MKISDEMLLAYVDNELDAAARAEVEAAIAADPEVARRVDQQRTLRKLLGAAYDPVLDEPVPPRLLAAAQPARARVVDLARARQSKRRLAAPAGGWGWAHWGGMAACLVFGLLVGRGGWLPMGEDIVDVRGQVVARGDLARALSLQLAGSQPADAPVRLGVSYLSRAGDYCRSFMLSRSGTSGLACRHGDDWALRLLAQDTPGTQGDAGLRPAASTLPPTVLRAIDEEIQTPLDARGEQAALQKGWRASGR
jgi:hypothetical protein